jgi:O-antigen/teichoic acid export membrane protein
MLMLARAYHAVARLRIRGWSDKSRQILVASSGFLLAGVILTAYQQVDTVVMSELVERDALGWYATADALFGTLLFVATIVMGAVFPVIGRLHAERPQSIPPLVRRSSSLLVMAGVPVGVGTFVIAVPLAPLLFGDAFRETGEVLMLLGPVIVLTFGTIVCGTVALATGRQRFWNVIMTVAIMISIPLDIVFVPWADRTFDNGAIGGAMSYLVTEAMLLALGLWQITPYLLERAFVWRVARIFAAGALMLAISWPMRERFIVLPLAVGLVGYFVALVVMRVPDADDRASVREMLGKATTRLPFLD